MSPWSGRAHSRFLPEKGQNTRAGCIKQTLFARALAQFPAYRKPWVPSLAAHKLGIVPHTVMFYHSCTGEVEARRSGVPGPVKLKCSLSSMILCLQKKLEVILNYTSC